MQIPHAHTYSRVRLDKHTHTTKAIISIYQHTRTQQCKSEQPKSLNLNKTKIKKKTLSKQIITKAN